MQSFTIQEQARLLTLLPPTPPGKEFEIQVYTGRQERLTQVNLSDHGDEFMQIYSTKRFPENLIPKPISKSNTYHFAEVLQCQRP